MSLPFIKHQDMKRYKERLIREKGRGFRKTCDFESVPPLNSVYPTGW